MFNLKRRIEKKEESIGKKKEFVKSESKVKQQSLQTQRVYKDIKKEKSEESNFYALSYKLLSKKIEFMYPRLIVLEGKMEKAAMPILYEAYICGMVLMSIIAGIVGLGAGTAISLLINIQPTEFRFLLPIISGAAAFQVAFVLMYMSPDLTIKSRQKKIGEELPYFMGYMATLASSGLALEGIFKAIANERTKEEIVKMAGYATRNIEVLGMDIMTALDDLIKRSPSEPFTELLEGLISTVQSGGSLKEYFISIAKVQMEEKKLLLKKMTESLGVVAEMYTILLVVFPLMAVVMMSIMAIMTGTLMGFDISTLMMLMTYLMVPIFGIMMLVMMDSMVPKR